MVEGPRVPAVGGLVELRQKGLAGFLAGVVGELDRDGLGGARRLLPVQTLDGLLGFHPLIKADEAHTSGAACGARRSETHTGPFYFTGFFMATKMNVAANVSSVLVGFFFSRN